MDGDSPKPSAPGSAEVTRVSGIRQRPAPRLPSDLPPRRRCYNHRPRYVYHDVQKDRHSNNAGSEADVVNRPGIAGGYFV